MMEAFIELHHQSVAVAEQNALLHIQSILEQNGMKCSDFKLPEVVLTRPDQADVRNED